MLYTKWRSTLILLRLITSYFVTFIEKWRFSKENNTNKCSKEEIFRWNNYFSKDDKMQNVSLTLDNFWDTKEVKIPQYALFDYEEDKVDYIKICISQISEIDFEFNFSPLIEFVGSRYKVLRMLWYPSMKPFCDNLKIVIDVSFWTS